MLENHSKTHIQEMKCILLLDNILLHSCTFFSHRQNGNSYMFRAAFINGLCGPVGCTRAGSGIGELSGGGDWTGYVWGCPWASPSSCGGLVLWSGARWAACPVRGWPWLLWWVPGLTAHPLHPTPPPTHPLLICATYDLS